MHEHRILRFGGLLSVALLTAWLPAGAQVRSEHCDPGLEQASGQLGYRPYEDRCEGLYVQPVGSTVLQVLSFTAVFEDFDASSGAKLRIAWEAPGDGPVRLRAQGAGRHYYRMDSLRPAGTDSYLWPPKVLAALRLTRREVGVTGWVEQRIGDEERQVYLPLRVTQERPATEGGYRLVLDPGGELDEVFVSLAPVADDGRPGRFLLDGEALGYGYYPARRPIVVPIEDPGAPGVYYLELGARLRGGGPTTTELWFFHPP